LVLIFLSVVLMGKDGKSSWRGWLRLRGVWN